MATKAVFGSETIDFSKDFFFLSDAVQCFTFIDVQTIPNIKLFFQLIHHFLLVGLNKFIALYLSYEPRYPPNRFDLIGIC